ncbi:hypothetical protein RvY_17135 [Ramazzottius varieornatus]|uniref:Uncharacterized protein n=1 Tax=Ramazzottius varieornatus TaxID=947166 RepID=A0A1D1W137_RAMVA|nr:hypothetical protein RvY_17135 [Ramazzottius varieornatus]
MKTAIERQCETKEPGIVCEKQVQLWRTKYMAMLKFCHVINDCFNLILFSAYCLDVLTLLGYTCSLTNISSAESVSTYLRLIFNCIVFASYGSLIPIPLVHAYENSEDLGFIVYWLKVSADGCRGTAKVSSATTDGNRKR